MTDDNRENKLRRLSEMIEQRQMKITLDNNDFHEVAPTQCDFCQDLGFIKAELPDSHPLHGKLIPCPECEMGDELRRDIKRRKFNQTRLPEHYADARLENWYDNLNNYQRSGKYLAYCFSYSFAVSGGYASVHEAITLLAEANDRYKLFKALPGNLQARLEQPDKRRFGLLLNGPVGIGKTWLMAAVLNAIRESHHVIFARSDDVLDAAMGTWGTPESQSEALAPYRHAEILFLDDMHIDITSKLSTYSREIMTSLIRHRYDHKMPTMITCNMEKSEFYEDWGKRLADAVMDMCHWIPIGGEKLRDTEQDWSAI